MSLIEKINNLDILPNQILEELMKHEVFQQSASHTILTLLENNWREENKEEFFALFTQKVGIWAHNDEQRDKIKLHLTDIKQTIHLAYGTAYIDNYIDEIIENLFPQQAQLTKQIQWELQQNFSL